MEAIYTGNDYVFGVDLDRLRRERLTASATNPFEGCGQGVIGTNVPPCPVKQGVDGETYGRYREGLISGCADIVVTATAPDYTHRVLAVKRAAGKCFGGSWWMMGGAVHAYRSLTDFVADRAEKECGVRPSVEACMFVAYTSATDVNASTTQLCFVGRVKWNQIEKIRADADHSAVKLLSFDQIVDMPPEELHWYPRLAFDLALSSM